MSYIKMAFVFKCSINLSADFLRRDILPYTDIKPIPDHLDNNPDFWDLMISYMTAEFNKKSTKNHVIYFNVNEDPRAFLAHYLEKAYNRYTGD